MQTPRPDSNTDTSSSRKSSSKALSSLPTRQSTRTGKNKRVRYEPSAMGEGPTTASGLTVSEKNSVFFKHLIVDTGVSHVLFREKDSKILSHIQMSAATSRPFAVLKAANGAVLDSIGRGMLTIGTVTVVAYIFRDADLVHNLLGVAPFADRGCTATFTATQFALYHHPSKPMLVGTRHAHNLWRIAMPEYHEPVGPLPAFTASQVFLLHQVASQPEAEHVRFVHATLGSSPPTTFLKAVARCYINGPRQFPRLTTEMVRKHMPNSAATARGHLRKPPTGQPHASSQAVSALQRHHKAQVIQNMWRTAKITNKGKSRENPMSKHRWESYLRQVKAMVVDHFVRSVRHQARTYPNITRCSSLALKSPQDPPSSVKFNGTSASLVLCVML